MIVERNLRNSGDGLKEAVGDVGVPGNHIKKDEGGHGVSCPYKGTETKQKSGRRIGMACSCRYWRRRKGHSERRAWMTSMRAARAAGSQEATTAAASSTNAERTTGTAPGILTSKK